jgi:hypothetical protein
MGRPTDRDSPFSGIDSQQLHDFINSMDRHTRDGGSASAQPLIGNWMSQASRIGLDTAALSKVTKHLSWAQDQLPMLRQRLFLSQRADQPYPGSPHMVEIDDGMVDSSTPAEIRQDSAEAVKLAALARTDPGKLSNDQLIRLNLLLELHDNNPYFAEQFATGLGPAATVKFYATLTDPRQFEVNPRSGSALSPDLKQREKLLGTLENSLGTTLATASNGDDPAMRQWQKTMISLGGKDLGDGAQYHVYGFQVMSDLMRHGSYGTAFLKSYGTALVAFEKTNTADVVGGLQRRVVQKDALPWEQPGMNLVRLHYGAGNDGGSDPMTGYMEALGHNPAASTAFFKDQKNFDYLTETRTWPEDYATDDAKTIAGYKSLGHALESATMGSPYDADPPSLHRTKDTAAVMTEVVNRYGQPATGTDTAKTSPSGADLLAREPGLAPSLGRMTAAYIDDVDWGLTGDETLNVFSEDDGGRAHGDRANFSQDNLEGFLGTLGHNDDAYRIVTNAQQAYSTSVLNAHPPRFDSNGEITSTDAQTTVRVGAQLQGIMDRAWVEQYKADGKQQDEKFNEQVDKRAERQQMITGLITGGAFAFVPEAEGGIRATVVPLATDAVHDQIDGQIEQNIGDYSDSQHRSLDDVRQGKASEVYLAGRKASWIPANQLVHGSRLNGWSKDQLESLNEILHSAQETGYSAGSLTQEQGGNLAVPN